MFKHKQRFASLATCLLMAASSTACSAQTLKANQPPAEPTALERSNSDMTDCRSLGKWNEAEACLGQNDISGIGNCGDNRPQTCSPYLEMRLATEKMQRLENEIKQLSTQAYGNYLANDPAYLKDLGSFLDASNESWASYRDAHCQLEPYINGMMRREFGILTEQCRLEKTKSRIAELEEVLTTLKSNLEK